MRNLSLHKTHIISIILTLIVVALVMVFFKFMPVSAGTAENVRGFAWGGTESTSGAYQGLGWVSTNNLSDGSGVNYGVNIPFSNGNLSGYAWSTHYGWISFNGADLSGCSPGLGQAVRSGNTITGGARIIAIRDAGGNAGGFDGCISLSGAGYGLTVSGSNSPYTLAGYAWSSDLGWINFSGVTAEFTPTASISVTGCAIALGSSNCNGSLTWNIVDAGSPNVFNQTTSSQYSTNPSGTNVPVALTYGSNTIVARNGSSVLQSTNVSIACAGIGGWNSSSGRCEDLRSNFTQPNVTYVPSATFDPVTGAFNYVDVTFQTQNNGQGPTGASAAYDVQLDRNNDGSYDTTNSGSIPSLAVGAYSTAATQRFNNVSLGTIRLRVAVDTTNAIAEVNESDNERIITNITLPPPNPNLEINLDRYQVRTGETVTITWNTHATYPMNCRVSGPGISPPYQFDPSISGSTAGSPRVSAPINAKSIFTLSCVEPVTNTTFSDSATVEAQGVLEEL